MQGLFLPSCLLEIDKLMMCDIESHGMQGLIHGTSKTPKENGDSKKKGDGSTGKCKRSDALVTVAISVMYGKDVMGSVVGIHLPTLPTSVINGFVVGNEVWMKKTAESYTITAAFIVTIEFAATIILLRKTR